jgi:hypothetical protein
MESAGEPRTAVLVDSQGQMHLYRAAGSLAHQARSISVHGDDGTLLGTSLVVDVDSALSRARHPSPLEQTPLPELFADEKRMQALIGALAKLAEVRPPAGGENGEGLAGKRRRKRVEDDVRRTVGSALLSLALGRTQRSNPPSAPGGELKGDTEGESGSHDQPQAKSGGPPLSPEAAIEALSERQRARLRRRIGQLVEQSAHWPLAAQLATYRITLILTAAGLWLHPQDWAQVLHEGLCHLWEAEEEESLAPEQAALAIVGLMALRHGLPADGSDTDLIRHFEDRCADFREYHDWVLGTTEETIELYASGLSGHTLGPRFTAPNICADLLGLLNRTPLDDALDTLDGIAESVEVAADGTVTVRSHKDARRTAINVLDRLRDFPDTHVVVQAAIEVHGWWNGRRLILARPVRHGWQADKWSPVLAGIAGFTGDRQIPPPTSTRTVASPAEAWAELGST